MRKYKESVESAALPKLSRDELIALDQQIDNMLRENGVYVDELYSYQEESSGVRHIQFDLSGDWKHEHMKTKLLMEQQGWSIYSKEELGDSGSDYYEAHYDFVYDKDFETYTNNMFTPEEKAQFANLFESYSPDLLNDLVNDYRYEYSAETHNEIWNKILETYNDEDLANDVLAALEDGDEYYEEDDDEYLTESEDDDDDDKYRHLEWDDINEIYNSALESAVDDYDGDPADVNGESMYDDFMTYLDKWNEMSNEEKDQYESVEDYFRDNIDYDSYIPEADDEDDEGEELDESEIDDDDDDDDVDMFDLVVDSAIRHFENTEGATEKSFEDYVIKEFNAPDWVRTALWNEFVNKDGKTVAFQEI